MSAPNEHVIPTNLPANQEDRRVLGEFWDLYKNHQWFRSANIVENHPTQMRKTLEINANYKPIVEIKDVLSFTHKYNLAVEWVLFGNR